MDHEESKRRISIPEYGSAKKKSVKPKTRGRDRPIPHHITDIEAGGDRGNANIPAQLSQDMLDSSDELNQENKPKNLLGEGKHGFHKKYRVKLDEKIHQLGRATSAGLDKWTTVVRQSLEREIKSLQESNQFLTKSRNEAFEQVRELDLKYQDILIKFKKLQLSDTSRLASLEAELKMKKFESERNGLLLEELGKKYTSLSIEKEKLAAKLDVTKSDYLGLKTDAERRINTIRLQLQNTARELKEYKKLEDQLNKIVLHVATASTDSAIDIDEMLNYYGYGPVVATQARVRLKQSLELATRVVGLEKRMSEMKDTIYQERNEKERLRNELDVAASTISLSRHPTRELLDLIYKRDVELKRCTDEIHSLKLEVSRFQKACETLGNEVQNEEMKPRLTHINNFGLGLMATSTPKISSTSLRLDLDGNEESDIPCVTDSRLIHFQKPVTFTKILPPAQSSENSESYASLSVSTHS